MRLLSLALVLALPLALLGCGKDTAPPVASAATEIAWREGDVDDALAEAKESGKPVFLYWGAKWCPPCNQIKSTTFKDPAFIARTQGFVPVYLDGDSPGAQKWGERFGIVGYPTVIILRPDGTEVTRLSSAATASRLADTLRIAAARTVSTEELLKCAQADPKALSPDEWALLADYDWQNDPRHFGESAQAVALLDRLAGAAPEPAVQRRFALLSLVIGSDDKPPAAAQQARLAQVLPAILANPAEVTANRQELSYSLPPLVAALPAAERSRLGASLVAALDKVQADPALPIPDRLGTVNADIQLAKAGGGEVSPAVLAKVRERAAWADGASKDAMERQSAISNAADLLHEAGDTAGARKLLEGELKRSASPYYYMLSLSRLAEDEKDARAAIDWARKAAEGAKGPATRVQWAIEYSRTVLRLAPNDKAAVAASADAVLAELAKSPDGYFQRTRMRVSGWGKQLREWSAAHGGADLLGRIDQRMAEICGKEQTGAEACRNWSRVA